MPYHHTLEDSSRTSVLESRIARTEEISALREKLTVRRGGASSRPSGQY